MNHQPAPEIRSRWRVVRWLQWVRRAAHFAAWEYGTCRDTLARRNRSTGAVQFVMWAKGRVVVGGGFDVSGHADGSDYVYPEDWWIDFNPYWWPEFRRDAPLPPRRPSP